MPPISRRFDSYKVRYESFGSGQPGATITCFLRGDLVGRMDFYETVPASRKNRVEDDMLVLVFRISSFNDVMTILRTKRALRLVLEPDMPTFPIGYVGS